MSAPLDQGERARACLIGMIASAVSGGIFGAGLVLLIGLGWVR